MELELVVVDAAGKSVDVAASEQADIGFFAIDPVRGANIAFSAAHVLIEGCYLVRQDSPLQANGEVDQAAKRVEGRRWRRLRPECSMHVGNIYIL